MCAGRAVILLCLLLAGLVITLRPDSAEAQLAVQQPPVNPLPSDFNQTGKKAPSAFPKQKGGVLGGPVQKIDRAQPLYLQGDELIYDNKKSLVRARGNVEIYYNNYILTADEVAYDQSANTLTAAGNVVIKEPNGNIVRADRYTLTDDFRDGFVQQLSVVTKDESRVTAERATRRDGNVTEFENARYTPCKTGDGMPPLWCISAARVIHDQQAGTITYQDAQFEFFGQPILYLPYFSHADPSVKRKSGFLVPDVSTSSTLGFSTEVPYYYALAPNMDFTFHPRYFSMQGVLWQGEWRHRLANGQYTIKLAGIDQNASDLPAPEFGYPDRRRDLDGWRGSVETRGEFSLGSWWKFGWDGTWESDDSFRRFYKLDGILQTDRVNSVYLRGLSDRNYFALTAYQFGGLLSEDTPLSVPAVHPVVDYNYVVDKSVIGGELSFNSNLMSMSRRDGSEMQRAIFEAKWRRQLIDPFGQVFTPFVNLRGDSYQFSQLAQAPDFMNTDNETFARGMATAGLTYSYPFVAHTPGASHIVEPTAQIITRPDSVRQKNLPNEDAQSLVFDDTILFDPDKFSGFDRLETGTRANVGIQYTYQPYSGGYVRTLFGQSYHLAGRNAFADPGKDPNAEFVDPSKLDPNNYAFNPYSGLNTNQSDYIAALYIAPFDNFRVISQTRLDDSNLQLERQDLSAYLRAGIFQTQLTYTYARDQWYLVQPRDSNGNFLPFQFERNTQRDILAAAGLQLTERWSLLGMIRYDFDTNSRIQDMIQLKYADECFVLTASYTETFIENPLLDIRPDRTFMLRFELKNLGGIGYKTDSLDHLFAENQPRQ